MTTSDQDTIWLTREAFDKLSAELEELKGPRRRRSSAASPPPVTRATSRRTAATTPPRRSRARSRPGSVSSRTCCAAPRSARRPRTTASSSPAWSSRTGSSATRTTDTFLLGAREIGDDRDQGRLAAVAPGRGHPRLQAGRHRDLQGAQRQDAQGRDRRGRPLRRLIPPAESSHLHREDATAGSSEPVQDISMTR